MTDTKPPKVFISYAWEDDLKTWVLDFATRLRTDGINAILDQWETVPGDQLPEFMEKSVRESDFVVFVCTPTYKRKSDRRKGGVGYEGHIITGEVFQKNNHRKFIPVLRKGKWATASPSWATSKLFIDFRNIPYSEASYQQLLNTLIGKLPTAPPVLDDSLREIVKRESAEKDERERIAEEIPEKAEQEVAEKTAREKVEREAAEKTAREKAQRESDKKVAQEKAERESSENKAREKVEHESAQDFTPAILKEKSVESSKPKIEKPETKKTKPSPKRNTAIVAGSIIWVGIICAVLIGFTMIANYIKSNLMLTPIEVTPDSTFTPTIILSIEPSLTATPPSSSNTADPVTATVAAALTMAAQAQLTYVATSTTFPSTGIADEISVPGLVIVIIVLVVLIFLVRQLRVVPKK